MGLATNLEFRIVANGEQASNGLSKVNKQLQNMRSASDKAHPTVSKLLSSLGRVAFYRLIRSAIKSVTDALSEGLKNAYMFSKSINGPIAQALDAISSSSLQMSNQLGAAFGELIATVQPMLLGLLNFAIRVSEILSQIFAIFGGRGKWQKATAMTKDWADSASGAGAAAKEWKNQLMGFDEINRLEEPSTPGGGGGFGGNAGGYEPELVELEGWAKRIQENLGWIEAIAGACMLGLGLILVATGANIPLGIGLIAAGAASLAASTKVNWDEVPDKVSMILGAIMLAAGAALFGIGLVMLLTGNAPLGIGLMFAGLAGMAAVAINWDKLPKQVQDSLTRIGSIVGAAMFIIGLIVALTGNPVVGLAMMAGGFAIFASTHVNWEELPGKVKGALDKIQQKWENFKSSLEQIKEKIKSIVDNIKQKFESFSPHLRLPHLDVTYSPASSSIARFFGIYDIPHINVSWYANGGFPDAGELYMARENGSELVGRIGNQNAVANNDQIIEGIRQGVYMAVMEANRDNSKGSSSHETVLNVNGKEFCRAIYNDMKAVTNERGISLVNA